MSTFQWQEPDLVGAEKAQWRKRLETALRDGRELEGDTVVHAVISGLIAQLDIRGQPGPKPGPIPAGVLWAAVAYMRRERENEARVARGQAPLPQLTQGQLASRAGMSKQAFAKWYGRDGCGDRWLGACLEAAHSESAKRQPNRRD